MVECWKSEANFSVESSSIFLEEVDKRRSSTLHKVITNVLCEANLFPYPSQSSDKLSSVDLYVAAFSALPERGFTSQTFPNWEEWNDSDAKNFLVGVVGVAWTSLSPGCVVEGYLHVVWVRPEYRRRRIVQQLLRRTLSITEGGPLSHRVMRWRLHTMKSSAATNEYLLATLRNGVARAVSFKATDDGGFDAADGNAAYEEELKDVELLFSAVKRMYKEFGFCVRRYIYKYYAGKADAVEMIKNIPRTRKESCRRTRGSTLLMPGPLASFTKTKWLSFFAELTAKITHHNQVVVLEGCELVKRHLMTQVSVAAFLEEGSLLLALVDTLAGNMVTADDDEQAVSTGIGEKLIFVQLETLSIFIDMMVSLHADREGYYCLLVQARAGVIFGTLVGLLRRRHKHFFGITSIMVKTLLELPLGLEVPHVQVSDTPSVALTCHLRQLQTAVEGNATILQDSLEVLKSLSMTTNHIMSHCTRLLFNLASKQLKRLRQPERKIQPGTDNASIANIDHTRDYFAVMRAKGGWPSSGQGENGKGAASACPPDPLASTTSPSCASTDFTKMSISKEDCIEESIFLESGDHCMPEEVFTECLEQLPRSQSHDEFLGGMNRLWCLTVAGGPELQHYFTSRAFHRAFRRFLQTMPTTNQDHVVFSSVLLWLSHVITNHYVSGETLRDVISCASPALMEMMLRDIRGGDAPLPPDDCSSMNNSLAQTSINSVESASALSSICYIQQSCTSSQSAPPTVVRKVGIPPSVRHSVSFSILSFLLVVGPNCDRELLERWVRQAGFFTVIETFIGRIAHVKSVLIDAPTTENGILSDEVYLSCAMAAVRTESLTLAALACKLLSAVVWNNWNTLCNELVSETSRMLQSITPLLLQVSINNPTLASAVENVSGSALHYLPFNQRSSRYTSLGECCVVLLDACLWLMQNIPSYILPMENILPNLGALLRATANSIHPAIRASPYRAVAHLCKSVDDVLLVAQEAPSLLKGAVNAVLEYSPRQPQWEAAAAGELLMHVISIVSRDADVEERFSFCNLPLATTLLELTAASGVTYATGTFLSLLIALAEQQRRLMQRDAERRCSCVLLPRGVQSVESWLRLVKLATWGDEEFLVTCKKVVYPSSSRKGNYAHALGSIEGITVQFYFICSLTRALQFLFRAYPMHRDYFDMGLLWSFFGSIFALPSPCNVFDSLDVHYGVRIEHHNLMECSYECMIRWTIDLFLLWIGGGSITFSCTDNAKAHQFATFSSKFFNSLCRAMQCDNLSRDTRADVCGVVSSIIVHINRDMASFSSSHFHQSDSEGLPALSGEIMLNSLSNSSAKLFNASSGLEPLSCVVGMQCRLISLFMGANERCRESGWFGKTVDMLEKQMKNLKGRDGPFPPGELDKLLVLLSSAFSVIAFSDCPPVSDELRQKLSAALHTAIGLEVTRRAAFQTALALANSKEGRHCLLREVTASGNPLARACFGRLLVYTLATPGSGEQCDRVKDFSDGYNMRSSNVNEQEANKMALRALGFDVCAAACIKGEEAFTHSVIRCKGVERIECILLKCEQERLSVPYGLLQIVAAVSFYADGQLAIIRRRELMVMLVELAADFSSAGTVSLLILRNLCFNPSLKSQLCQEDRILEVFKESLSARMAPQLLQELKLDDNDVGQERALSGVEKMRRAKESTAKCRKKEGGNNSPRSYSGADVMRRKELAATAYWSLMYDNQRGKSHVRNVLNKTPPVKIDEIVGSIDEARAGPAVLKCFETFQVAVRNIKMLSKGVS